MADEFHTTRCTAGAVSLGSRGLCFLTGLPVAAAGAPTAEAAPAAAVTPAGGVCAAERVSTGVSGSGCVLALEEGAALPTTEQTQRVTPASHQHVRVITFHLIFGRAIRTFQSASNSPQKVIDTLQVNSLLYSTSKLISVQLRLVAIQKQNKKHKTQRTSLIPSGRYGRGRRLLGCFWVTYTGHLSFFQGKNTFKRSKD